MLGRTRHLHDADRNAAPQRTMVFKTLQSLIASGLLQPGDELPSERSLALMFHVARAPVRSALSMLERQELLSIQHGKCTRIRSAGPRLGPGLFTSNAGIGQPDNRRASAEARAVIGSCAIRLLGHRMHPHDLAALEALVAQQKEFQSHLPGFLIADHQFESVLYLACGNPVLHALAMQLYRSASLSLRNELERDEQREAQLFKRRALVAALMAGDEPAAICHSLVS